MIENMELQELYVEYGDTEFWEEQIKLMAKNPILYLSEYQNVPEAIFLWKEDEELHPAATSTMLQKYQSQKWDNIEKAEKRDRTEKKDRIEEKDKSEKKMREKEKNQNGESDMALCMGIGKYQTEQDGEIYLCAVINQQTRAVMAYSIGVYRSAELVRKALKNLICLYPEMVKSRSVLLTSQNPIYKTKLYEGVIKEFPFIEPKMTEKGTRGGAAAVSTYFSQLMRRKGSRIFYTWQEAIDWLSMDILKYNLRRIFS